jgi:hypothetical protein
MKTEEPNPYQPTVMEGNWREELDTRRDASKPMTLQDLGIAILVLVWFFTWGGIAFKTWLNERWVISIVCLTLCLMSIPISVRSEPLAKRFRYSFVVAFTIGGALVSLIGYFHMAGQGWFAKLGMAWLDDFFGLVAFGLTGLIGGGYFGWRLLKFAWPEQKNENE